MATERPWMKWYWSLWRSDPKLRNCSMAARGLWAEMLAIMDEATPRGFLAINGEPLTMQQLAMQAGWFSVEDIEKWVEELRRNGVFSENNRRIIYSRRMVSDEKKANTARTNGQKGGRKPRTSNTQNEKNNSAVGTAKPNQTDNRTDNQNGTDPPTETQTENAKSRGTIEERGKNPPYPLSGDASPEGDLIFEAVDALLSRIWPEAPKAMDARLLEADCHEFARMGAKPKIVADALTARLRHMATHSAKPPGQLEPWGAELVLTRLQRMARVKRGNADWQPDWGPEPSADELAAFEIPVDLRLASDPPAEPVDARGYPPSPEFLKRRKANATG